jgi:hypothetical protein
MMAADRRISVSAMCDMDTAEHVLAASGRAVVSSEIGAEIERIERERYRVPLAAMEAVLYAIYSGPYGDYHRAKQFA